MPGQTDRTAPTGHCPFNGGPHVPGLTMTVSSLIGAA